MRACVRSLAVRGFPLLLGMAAPAAAFAEELLPPTGSRVRATTVDHGRVEGTVAWHDATGMALRCEGYPQPVWVPAPNLTLIEVYTPPPSRMEVYAAVGGFVGLGLGLLVGLPEVVEDPCAGVDPLDCDPSRYEKGDSAAVRVIALSALGVGLGAIAGLAVERENAWKPVSMRWDPRDGTPRVQVALRF